MIIFNDFGEFFSRVRMLTDIDDFEGLEIQPSTLLGTFYEHRLEEMIAFCKEKPLFHIVSRLGKGQYINGVDTKAICFRLALGDNNPEIAFYPNFKSGFQL